LTATDAKATTDRAAGRPARGGPRDGDQPAGDSAGLDAESDAEARARRLPIGHLVTYAALAVGGCAADLVSKAKVFAWRGLPGQRDVYWIIDGYFGIETAVNIGAVFGLGAGMGTLFAALSIVAGGGITIWLFRYGAIRSRWLTVALGCVTGGILGNLYDRLGLWWQPGYPPEWKSGVRDWILWQAGDSLKWPNFNIADSLLVVGACMLLVHSFQATAETHHEAPHDDDTHPDS